MEITFRNEPEEERGALYVRILTDRKSAVCAGGRVWSWHDQQACDKQPLQKINERNRKHCTDQEQKSAKKIYQDYLAAKKILTRNVGGDILFLILTVLIMMVPFIAIKSIVGFTVGTVLAYVLSAGVFAGLFIVSLILTIMPYVRKMKTAKQQMLECYKNCLAKKKVALAQLKRRYEVDLINIEEFRYEIRQISLLYQLNLEKDKKAVINAPECIEIIRGD